MENDSLALVVTAHDPDGEAITSLVAVGLPPGATFTADPGDTSGTLQWKPAIGQAGIYMVVFDAANPGTGSDTTVITVTNPVAGVWVGPAIGPPLVPRVAPSPFRDRAHLRFSTAHDGALRVEVFDLAGRIVRTLLDESQAAAGEYDLGLEVHSGDGSRLAQGLYFYRIQTPEGTARGRFMVLR